VYSMRHFDFRVLNPIHLLISLLTMPAAWIMRDGARYQKFER